MKTGIRRVLIWELVTYLCTTPELNWSGTMEQLRTLLKGIWDKNHPELEGGFFPLHARHSPLAMVEDFRDELLELGWEPNIDKKTQRVFFAWE